jgi:hypothetical protein
MGIKPDNPQVFGANSGDGARQLLQLPDRTTGKNSFSMARWTLPARRQLSSKAVMTSMVKSAWDSICDILT